MHEPSYSNALRRAFELARHHKTLWVFGVLSLLLGQIGWNNFIGGLVFFSEKQTFSSYFFSLPWVGIFQGTNFFWSLWLVVIMLAL